MARSIRGLVFDFDGLILDTEGPEYAAWSEAYRDYGYELALESWVAGIGTQGGFDPYAHLAALSGRPVVREEVSRRVRERVAALVAQEAVRPGVEAYLKETARRKLRVGLASSSSRKWVVGHLATLGLLDRFHVLCCRGDAPRVKPAPDLYLAAAASLGLQPDEAIALEDSPNGVMAAKEAGFFCAAVPHGPTAMLDFSRADVSLSSLEEMPLPELIALAERTG